MLTDLDHYHLNYKNNNKVEICGPMHLNLGLWILSAPGKTKFCHHILSRRYLQLFPKQKYIYIYIL